jgi:SWI/SNF-related matrix-associated actin-dependent regulator of chromatin subfamily A member 5
MQRDLYKKTLMRDMSTLQMSAVPGRKVASKSKLCNIVMQLRKVCNHPYLFEGVEDRELDPMGEHLIENCGKLQLLDKLLARLKSGGHRVLIFSQMTRLLDILEDYCWIRKHKYCRLDGQTAHDLRTEYIDGFNAPNSDKFLFLLSTRAGGLGINLQTADTVILFDSDWNPQVDLQAQDRAHRIGQKKQVHIYRLLTADTIEEKILERAELKLRMDAVVIQGGRAESNKGVDGHQMLAAIRYGADKVFRGDGATITDDDIDAIIDRGKEKTEAMKKVLEEKAQGDMLDFKLEYTTSLQEFDGIDYTEERKRMEEKKKQEALSFALLMGDAIGKRARTKTNYREEDYYRRIYEENDALNAAQQRMRKLQNNALNKIGHGNSRVARPRDYPSMKIWQFFDLKRLAELQEKENDEYRRRCTQATLGNYKAPENKEEQYIFLNEEDQAEKILLLKSGFKTWSRHNYRQFVRACANYGRDDIEMICEEMRSASGNLIQPEETRRYHKIYFEKGLEVFGKEEYNSNEQMIKKGESKVEKIKLQVKDVQTVVQNFIETEKSDPRQGLNLIYNNIDTDKYTEENDAFLMCEMASLGKLGFFDEMRRKLKRVNVTN